MRLVPRIGLIATVVASAAIAAPSALAGVPAGLGLSGVAGSPALAAHEEGQSFRWFDSHPATISPAVRPNPDQQLPVYKPAAAAVRPNPDQQLPAYKPAAATPVKPTIVPTRLGDRVVSGNPSPPAPVTAHEVPSTAKPAVSRDTGSQGFQFDDAAVGAGVMAGLTLLGLGAMLAVRRRSQLIHS